MSSTGRGVHARRRLPARGDGVAGTGRYGRLRARARRRRRRRQGARRVDRRRGPVGMSGHSTCDGSTIRTAARGARWRGRRGALAVSTSSTRGGRSRGAAVRVSPLGAPRHLGAAFGEKGDCERVDSYESNAPHGDESLGHTAGRVRARRPRSRSRHGPHASPPRSRPSSSRAGGLGHGALASSSGSREPDRPPRRTVVYTQLLNTGEPSRPISRLAARRRSLPARHRHRVRQPRPCVARAQRAARRLGLRERRDVCVRVPLSLGAPRA